MEDIINIIKKMNDNCVFTEDLIIELIKNTKKDIKKSTIRWALFHLCQNKEITKIGVKTYKVGIQNKYNYKYISSEAQTISVLLQNNFPNIKIAIWDEKILNEWMNLLLTQNIVFVEVEKDYMDFVFEKIKEEYDGSVIFNPSMDDLYRYRKDNIIVVKPLVSKAPINIKERKIVIEKLIVDLLYDKMISKLIDTKESYEIISSILNNYEIDYAKLLSYAERKHKKNEMIKLIKIGNENVS